jgi:hypothetical protein
VEYPFAQRWKTGVAGAVAAALAVSFGMKRLILTYFEKVKEKMMMAWNFDVPWTDVEHERSVAAG